MSGSITIRTSSVRAPVTNDIKQHQAALAAQGSRAPPIDQGDLTNNTEPARTAQNETVYTTAKHPWLTADRGFVKAGTLFVGEQVVCEDGASATVVAVAVRPGAADYYNLTVSNLHTYAVGIGRYVVHNCGTASTIDEQTSQLDKDRPGVVIGENMERVDATAKELREAGYEVRTYKPRPSNIRTLRNELEANRSRLRYWRDVGAQVVDWGTDPSRLDNPSLYYGMENQSIYENWGYRYVIRYQWGK